MKELLRRFRLPILIALVFMALGIWLPDVAKRTSLVTLDYLKEIVLIMPPVFILMGLLDVWIPKDKIQKWLGSGSGIKGAALSFALGTLPTGPLYVAFPMAGSLLKKGARVSNMVIFLGSWGALKIPQLIVEVKFLGLPFAALRFILTLLALILMGMFIEYLLLNKQDKATLENSPEGEINEDKDKT